ncbi:hypothetical protein NC651_036445 [Populus alba x Populus x berolinensis]|nr:hypothetical protein NC651_036445 [Populus alba x Populus x berolinensis]
MYVKCGSLDDALRVFESMPHENEVSWNAMISALAFHGQAVEALSLFRRMSKDNGTVHPNDISFIGVLSVCVHARLVDEGRQSMKLSFGLVPKVKHYSCVVDLWNGSSGEPEHKGDFITILSNDCGEVKSSIPSEVLSVLESKLQKLDVDSKDARIAYYFDFIAGTSTRGIILISWKVVSQSLPDIEKMGNLFPRKWFP